MTNTTADSPEKWPWSPGVARHRGGDRRRLARDGAAVASPTTPRRRKPKRSSGDEAAGGRALAVRADSADVGAVRNAVATTVETFGGSISS